MADLTAKTRNALPAKDFGEPATAHAPVPDREQESHAVDAKGRAKQQLNKGRISQAAYDKIVSKANAKLGE